MNKIIFIYFVLMTTYSNAEYKCETSYDGLPLVCGTDGKTYGNLGRLNCEIEETEYGKRINLQLKHDGACWIWEKYGYDTYAVILVSKFQRDLISIDDQSYFCLNYVAELVDFLSSSYWCVLVHLWSFVESQTRYMERR